MLLSGSLGWLLLRFGWTLEDSRQVVVVDDRGRLAERVVAIEIGFPTSCWRSIQCSWSVA